MINKAYLAHLEDLLDAARTIPNFPLAEELSALAEAIAEGDA